MKNTCCKCGLPSGFHEVRFGKNGKCNFCNAMKPKQPFGIEKLKKDLKYNRNNKNFDCIVPISGGKDSTYALYVAKVILKMNVLAVSFKNPFGKKLAEENMINACKKLGVELRFSQSKNRYDEKCVKWAIKFFKPLGYYFGVCEFCHTGINLAVFNEAKKENINTIIWGNTKHENVHIPKKTKADILFKSYSKLRLIDKLIAVQNFFIFCMFSFLQRLESFFLPVKNLIPFIKPYPKEKIKNLFIYDYIEWDANKIVNILKKECDWESPVGVENYMRFDCAIEALGELTWIKAFGVPTSLVILANLVRLGKANRNDVINKLKNIKDIKEGIEKEVKHMFFEL